MNETDDQNPSRPELAPRNSTGAGVETSLAAMGHAQTAGDPSATDDDANSASGQGPAGKYTEGGLWHHMLVLTGTSAIGLMAIFLVDLADLYFLSLLGEVAIAAAVGYAGSVVFFTASIGIGLAIATTALVLRALGARDMPRARRLATHALLFALLVSCALSLLVWFCIQPILSLLGATGDAHVLATLYLSIVVPSMPLMAIGICCSGMLRAAGDARLAMIVTLAGAAVNAILDPILIFGFDMGVAGAAWASVATRVTFLAVGLYGVMRVHDLIGRPDWRRFLEDVPAVGNIAVLAVLTNIATPVGNGYVTTAVAPFGDGAVAGWAIVVRVMPVAFGALFALSGAVGPILGQNLGAGRLDRVRTAFDNALWFTGAYMLAVWALLAMSSGGIIAAFGATGEAARLVEVFCLFLAPLFAFNAAIFVSNAAFNNLGAPHLSTLFNWGRATLGNVPFVLAGTTWFGAPGAIGGNLIGALFFGVFAVRMCQQRIDRLAQADAADGDTVASAAVSEAARRSWALPTGWLQRFRVR